MTKNCPRSEDIKDYILTLRSINPIFDTTPTHKSPGSPCETECSCWITDKLYTDKVRNTTRISYNKKTWYLHRLSYTLFKGSIPKLLVVGHKCDNSRCFNPDHLELISQKKNIKDAVDRGRRKYDNSKTAKTKEDRKKVILNDPYDYKSLLDLVKLRIDITDKNEWLYNKGLGKDGYAEIVISGKKYKLHRLILANKLNKKYEDIAIARHVLPDGSKPHSNDVNPDHLIEGNRSQNSIDTVKYNKNVLLTIENVKNIKQELKQYDFSVRGLAKEVDKKIALKYGVSNYCISDIRNERTFKWVEV